MGAYLSEPVVEKFSSDDKNELVEVGSSSMQGWRVYQEDAHNCILDYDNETSLFALFDGHGGAEVAKYCREMLPEFLKNLPSYKEKNLDIALKDAFIGFDATLLHDEVIEKLKILAVEKINLGDDEVYSEEDLEENLAELRQEGTLPLDKVLEKYKECASKIPYLNKLKREDGSSSGSGLAKPLSPYLRGRRNITIVADETKIPVVTDDTNVHSTLKNVEHSTLASSSTPSLVSNASTVPHSEVDFSFVSSTSNKKSKSPEPGNSSGKESSGKLNGEVLRYTTPDSSSSSSSNIKNTVESLNPIQNGEISSHEAVATVVNRPASSKMENVCSSSIGSSADKLPISSKNKNCEMSDISPTKQSHQKLNTRSSEGKMGNVISSTMDIPKSFDSDDDSSSDDADFHAEENSSTEDEDECDQNECNEEVDDDDEDDDNEETDDEEEGVLDEENAEFCTNMSDEPGKDSGCTAVVALLKGRDLYVANAGDSRCIVCRNGEAIEMSLDHKPEDEIEYNRITKAGGRVTFDGRVNGGLNLSRAIGDHAYKMNKDIAPEEQMISALPDIRKLVIMPEDEFMVLACDGIWNFMTNDDVINFVKDRINLNDDTMKLSKICEQLFDHCLAKDTMGDGTGCDNMTAVIVRFKPKILDMPTEIPDNETCVTMTRKRIIDCDSIDPINKKAKLDTNCISSINKIQTNIINSGNEQEIPTPSTNDDNDNDNGNGKGNNIITEQESDEIHTNKS